MAGVVLKELSQEGEFFAFTRSYALSSLLAFYTTDHPQVTVLGRGSVHGRNHILWFTPTDHTGTNALFVTYKPASAESGFIEKRFKTWETVIEADGPEESLISIIKCYGYNGIR